jgi:hypothetical protein
MRKYIYKGDILWETGTIVSEPDVFQKLYAIESENQDIGVFKLIENVVEHFKLLLFSGQIWEIGKITYKLRKTKSEHHEKNI